MKKNIYVIGAGGVGSWLVPSLCLLESPKLITVIDGDRLEDGNLNRQLFTRDEVGENKAEALARKYGCRAMPSWFSAGVLRLYPDDWLFVCADKRGPRLDALVECDLNKCAAIVACNETHSAEAFLYLPEWKELPINPRRYYPELLEPDADDPRARAIGCTGEAQRENPQLVSANFMAAALAQHLYVLWAMEFPKMDRREEVLPRLPYKLNANLSKLETHRIKDTYAPDTK